MAMEKKDTSKANIILNFINQPHTMDEYLEFWLQGSDIVCSDYNTKLRKIFTVFIRESGSWTHLSLFQGPFLIAWLFFISWSSFHFRYFMFWDTNTSFSSTINEQAFCTLSRRHFESRLKLVQFLRSADVAFHGPLSYNMSWTVSLRLLLSGEGTVEKQELGNMYLDFKKILGKPEVVLK